MIRQTLILVFVLLACLPAVGAITYVDAGATGANNGTSWANAFKTIQAGVDAASALGGGEVWVKAGTYTGASNPNPSDSFEALDANSVDILGEEKNVDFTSGGQLIKSHATVWYLTGSLTTAVPTVPFASTTNQDSLTARLLDLRNGNSNVLIWVNHPSRSFITREDLLTAANANVLPILEVQKYFEEDIQKWDYVLANLDDQAGDCRKMVWAICSDDSHRSERVDYKRTGFMLGSIPTAAQDPVYSDRRLAAADMMRRGSLVAMAKGVKCSMPTYTLTSSGGCAESIRVTTRIDRIGTDPWVEIRFYGCDWATGSHPGTLLYSQRVAFGSTSSVTYYLTQTGLVAGTALTPQQKANIKYIRVTIATGNEALSQSLMEPVRIKSSGDWWNGPAVTLAGHQATVGPSPYPAGGADTGESIYFNSHSHSIKSDGNSAPSTMRRVYRENYTELDPAKPKFDVLTDHEQRTPLMMPVSSVVALKEGVHLYAGFAGNETSRDARDWHVNHTVIDAANLGRCVYCDGSNWSNRTNATLDGFELKRGRAGAGCGGSMRVWKASPVVRNCTFTDNQALYGGAMCNSGSNADISACIFRNNLNGDFVSRGGGMLNDLASSPSISDCTFTGNQARRGGAVYEGGSSSFISNCLFESNYTAEVFGYHGLGAAMYNRMASTVVSNCLFRNNTSATSGDCAGGAVYVESLPGPTFDGCRFEGNSVTGSNARGGGMYILESSPSLLNCVFVSNSTPSTFGLGGAVYMSGLSSPRMDNNTMVGNTAYRGGAVFADNSSPRMTNNIVAFNTTGLHQASGTSILSHNNVFSNTMNYTGAGPGDGDISADPLFVNRISGDYHLTAWSPCVDAGKNEPGMPSYDLDGMWRVWGTRPDIGALEYSAPAAKSMADGQPILWSKAVVTAAFPDIFYVESENRTLGNRVNKPNHGVQAGMTVEIHGTVRTNDDGERYIEANTAVQDGTAAVEPLFMLNRSIGGGDWRYNPTTGMGHRGIAGDRHLNNIGLLISTTGSVTYACPSYFYIDDGSALNDGSGHLGVKVLPYGLPVPAYGDRVRVTGACSCSKLNGNIARLIRATQVLNSGQ